MVSLLVCLSVAGCGKSSGTISVSGHVSFRGTPLSNTSLTFFPTRGRPVAVPVVDGQYSTQLLPGEYTVVAAIGIDLPPGFKEGQPLPPPKITLPEVYTSRLKSTLKATVKAGQSEPIDFDLK